MGRHNYRCDTSVFLKHSSGGSAARTLPEGSREEEPGVYTNRRGAGLVSLLLLAENVWQWPSGHLCFSDLSVVRVWRTGAPKQWLCEARLTDREADTTFAKKAVKRSTLARYELP